MTEKPTNASESGISNENNSDVEKARNSALKIREQLSNQILKESGFETGMASAKKIAKEDPEGFLQMIAKNRALAKLVQTTLFLAALGIPTIARAEIPAGPHSKGKIVERYKPSAVDLVEVPPQGENETDVEYLSRMGMGQLFKHGHPDAIRYHKQQAAKGNKDIITFLKDMAEAGDKEAIRILGNLKK